MIQGGVRSLIMLCCRPEPQGKRAINFFFDIIHIPPKGTLGLQSVQAPSSASLQVHFVFLPISHLKLVDNFCDEQYCLGTPSWQIVYPNVAICKQRRIEHTCFIVWRLIQDLRFPLSPLGLSLQPSQPHSFPLGV